MKGYEKVKELIEGELEDYSYFEIGELKWDNGFGSPDEEDGEEHYVIDITMRNDKTKTLRFSYDRKTDKIGIELSEDNYEEVDDYSYRIKYFWMALLEW